MKFTRPASSHRMWTQRAGNRQKGAENRLKSICDKQKQTEVCMKNAALRPEKR